MKRLIPLLTDRLERLHDVGSKIPVPKFDNVVIDDGSEPITHDWLWRVGEFFKSNDVILAETGKSFLFCFIHCFVISKN
jgi:TPP-dependent 2-oxoacid decarboxylase